MSWENILKKDGRIDTAPLPDIVFDMYVSPISYPKGIGKNIKRNYKGMERVLSSAKTQKLDTSKMESIFDEFKKKMNELKFYAADVAQEHWYKTGEQPNDPIIRELYKIYYKFEDVYLDEKRRVEELQ
tara:strand:+ start:54 stop:437 length:384 start_codon:yes stop_codon:yes gene_type:complete